MIISFFPLKKNNLKNTRFSEKYKVNGFKTDRYKKSSLIYMQNLLNYHEKEKEKSVRYRGN